MGIVIHGRLYRGATGNAGEVGHVTYDGTGPFCHCGNRGCLEVYVSSEALLAEARAALTPPLDVPCSASSAAGSLRISISTWCSRRLAKRIAWPAISWTA